MLIFRHPERNIAPRANVMRIKREPAAIRRGNALPKIYLSHLIKIKRTKLLKQQQRIDPPGFVELNYRHNFNLHIYPRVSFGSHAKFSGLTNSASRSVVFDLALVLYFTSSEVINRVAAEVDRL